MKAWMIVAVFALILGVGLFLGASLFPQKILVTVEKPPASHTVAANDTMPYAVMRDSVAKLLAQLGKPTPQHKPVARPVPTTPFFMPQRQVIYGFSFTDGELVLSLFDSLAPHYRMETYSGMAENILVEYDDTASAWQIESWTNVPTTLPGKAPAKWRPWRFTASATLGWMPGEAAYVEAAPGVLIFGHLAIGPTVRWNFADLRSGKADRLRLGGRLTLVW